MPSHPLLNWLPIAATVWLFLLSHIRPASSGPVSMANQTCDVVVDAGPDTSLCPPGGLVQLNGSFTGNAVAWQWFPVAGLSDPSSLTPEANVSGDVTYTLTVFAHDTSAPNLVVNGDFETGNSAFSTDYTYVMDQPGFQMEMFPEGTYTVINNPNLVHTGFSACSDHTGNGGNMIVVNGAANFQDIWCQTISVEANAFYNFSAWVASVNPASPAQLQFSINGQPIGDIFTATSALCVWQPFNAVWSSGNATSAEICILNLNTQPSGNDFALDDISFIELCSATDEVEIQIIQETAPFPVITGPEDLCSGALASYVATFADTMGILSYEWTTAGGALLMGGQGTDSATVLWDGSGEICLEVGTLCDSSQTCFQVATHDPPDFPEINGPDFLCFGETTTFLTNDDPLVDSIAWYLPPGMELLEGASTTTIAVLWNSSASGDLCIEVFNGCGSTIACLPIETESNEPSTLDTTICSGTTFFVNGTEYGEANLYGEELMQSQNGCDSLVVVVVNVSQPDTIQILTTSCVPADTGTSIQVIPGTICDTILIINTLLVESDTTLLALTTCNPLDTGTTITLLTNEDGCDSLVMTHVTFSPSDSTWIEANTCTAADSGSISQHFQNMFGCDSIVTTTLVYRPTDTTWLMSGSCVPADTGISETLLSNQWGCDSLIIRESYLLASDTTSILSFVCAVQDSGTTQTLFVNAAGCDSLVIGKRVYAGSDTTFVTQYSCLPADTGVAVQVGPNMAGCDSVVVTMTTLLDPALCTIDMQVELAQPDCAEDPAILQVTPLAGLPPFYIHWEHTETGTTGAIDVDSLTAQAVELWQGGTYTVTLNSANGLQTATQVTVSTPQPLSITAMVLTDYGGYQVSCPSSADGAVAVEILQGGTPPLSVLWADGDTTRSVVSLAAGTYRVTITDARGCQAVDSVSLTAPSPVDVEIAVDNVSCYGAADGFIRVGNLSGGVAPYEITLDSLMVTGTEFHDLSPGSYLLQVADQNGCDTVVPIDITEPPELWIDLGPDTTIFPGESLLLTAEAFAISAAPSIIWDPPVCAGCQELQVAPAITTLYTAELQDIYGCSVRDSVLVRVINDVQVYAPNVFSPNGDGINDIFHLQTNLGITVLESLRVFNRWGEMVFEKIQATTTEADGWDGTMNGSPLPPGVYVYTAQLVTRSGQVLSLSGDVTLIR
ncbi:MAG: gliding motility-associated C-terminal domain-containing protein [Saprospiraceae bacterium]|nr:gliding motility-associated C-terminal domain-containing protein [Saprospiraceae bacterium]